MKTLLPYLKLFSYAKFPLFLGLVLMIVGLSASIGLLTLSGWFLSATAIAGAGALFNYFYPSSSVRGLAIGRTVARYFEKIVTHDATFRLLAKLRVQVFSKIIPLSPAVLNRYRNADLLNRLVADVDTLDSLYLRLVAPFLSALIVISFITFGLSFIDVPLALFIGGSLLVFLLVIPTIFYRLGKSFGKKLTQERASYRSQFVQFIQAQAELVLFGADQQFQQKLNKTEQQWQNYQQQEAKLSGLSNAILLFANGLILLITLWFAAQLDLGEGIYKAALLALFAFAALSAFEILMPLGSAFLHIGQIVASAERLSEITEQSPLVQFNGNLTFEDFQSAVSNSAVLLEIEKLQFSYPHFSQQAIDIMPVALQDFSLTIKQGQKVAILGKTGSGKSTLLQLLVRNYEANQGNILLAGKSLADYNETALRQIFCFLTQRIHVFSDTLRNNLQIASTEAISDEKMIEVLNQVGLAKLLEMQCLDIWLGDGGRPLSGGEQRRLGLARILLNQAPILLLDEPTEGLDPETERHILQLIFEHCQNKTLIMVTHRLTEIEQFDEICVVDNGQLMEKGDYSALSTKEQGLFKSLLNRI